MLRAQEEEIELGADDNLQGATGGIDLEWDEETRILKENLEFVKTEKKKREKEASKESIENCG